MVDTRQPAQEDLAAELMGLFLPIHYRIGVGFEETLRCGRLSRKQVAILWLMRAEGGPEGSMRRKDIERLLASWFETSSSTITRSLAALARPPLKLVRVIGDRAGLPPDIRKLIEDTEEVSRSNERVTVIMALNYGSRQEIAEAARRLAAEVQAGSLDPAAIDEAMFASRLSTSGIPDPDLLIRTSGEQRISNFLLWQCAYAELVFVDTLWPDFGKEHLEQAVAEFRRRERRYGGVGS